MKSLVVGRDLSNGAEVELVDCGCGLCARFGCGLAFGLALAHARACDGGVLLGFVVCELDFGVWLDFVGFRLGVCADEEPFFVFGDILQPRAMPHQHIAPR